MTEEKQIRIAVIGGGINGLCVAWALQKSNASIVVYEKNTIASQTSSSSTKLLHGGLRYLENFEFRLVKEALSERHWWLNNAPEHLVNPISLILPHYAATGRPRWMLKCGLSLYDFLAGNRNIEKHSYLSNAQIKTSLPHLKQEGLHGGYRFHDGQMDDHALALWVAEKIQSQGVSILENTNVERISASGQLIVNGETQQFDHIVNVAGPWAQELLYKSQIDSDYRLDLVRGSHILINSPLNQGALLQVPHEKRIFFTLPYKNMTMIGTTEVRQEIDEEIKCSDEEASYLLQAYNHYFTHTISESDISDTFAGVRPLIFSSSNPSKATREYKFESVGSVTTVFGGKWTTARALGHAVAKEVLKQQSNQK